MTDGQKQILDDTLSDLDSLPLSDEQKAQIIRDEAGIFNDPVSDDGIDKYLSDHGLPVGK